jgi:TonB family protein
MKTKFPLLVCVLFMAGAVNAQTSSVPDPVNWTRYTVKNEEFSVTLPTIPAMVTNKQYSAGLKKERKQRYIAASADGVRYSIQAYENPKSQQSLEAFIAEQAAEYGQDVSTAREVSSSGFAGKEFSYVSEGKPGTERYFATQDRLYRFVAHGAPAEHPGVKQFFASIMLGKNPLGIAVSDGPGVPIEPEPAGRVYTGREVDKKIQLKSRPAPDYPDAAKQHAVTGVVVLKAVFSSDGKVTNIRVVQGLPYGLTERAIEAARKIKFIPASKDGKFVSMWMQLEYNFNLF